MNILGEPEILPPKDHDEQKDCVGHHVLPALRSRSSTQPGNKVLRNPRTCINSFRHKFFFTHGQIFKDDPRNKWSWVYPLSNKIRPL